MSDSASDSTGIPLAPVDEIAICEAQVLIEQFNAMLDTPEGDLPEAPPTTYWHRRIAVLRREAARVKVLEPALNQVEQERDRLHRELSQQSALVTHQSQTIVELRARTETFEALQKDREHLLHHLELHREQAERLCSEISVLSARLDQSEKQHAAVATALVELSRSRAWRFAQLLKKITPSRKSQ